MQTANARVYVWGSNSYGQLGLGINGSTIQMLHTPFLNTLFTSKGVRDISCSSGQTFVLTGKLLSFGLKLNLMFSPAAGEVWGVGLNSEGQFPNTTGNAHTPVKLQYP